MSSSQCSQPEPNLFSLDLIKWTKNLGYSLDLSTSDSGLDLCLTVSPYGHKPGYNSKLLNCSAAPSSFFKLNM